MIIESPYFGVVSKNELSKSLDWQIPFSIEKVKRAMISSFITYTILTKPFFGFYHLPSFSEFKKCSLIETQAWLVMKCLFSISYYKHKKYI